ncbi:MAG: tetratricopeptide repeat protein, partial [candidate division Zixibacteria bacterium]|nr:tetratricopeptide repeat protein [candidate division Zixibacteria bacterium]
MWQVSRIIEFLHLQGIIHCDLKPDNFKIAQDESSPHPLVKLLDFGLADSPELIKENKVKGTLHFIAPEILKSQDYTKAADLYSLGVILYQLATGRLPFDAADPAVLISHILNENLVPPRQISDAVSEELENLITKLLTKDPAHRISSATEVREFFESQSEVKRENVWGQDWRPVWESGDWVSPQPAWDKISSFLKVANRSNKKLVLICGNPGAGKKRGMSETLYHCQKQGLPVFLGKLNSRQTGLRDAFLDRLANFCRYSPPELAQLSAQIDSLKSGSKSVDFHPRLVEVLSQIPAVVLIESVEYETDLQLLVGLAERYGRIKSQIFVSFNPFPGQMGKLEQFIHSRPETEQIELVQILPLATEQMTQLLKSKLSGFSVPEELLTQVWDHSGGNPALVMESLADLWNVGRLEFRRGKIALTKKTSVPKLLAHEDYFRWTKAGLSPAQLAFLQKASILGNRFELQAAVELTGEPLTVVYDYLKSLLTEGVLIPVATDDTLEYEFSPPILQQFFHAENTREDESKLHHRAARYWEERKSKGEKVSAQRIARHFVHSPDAEKGYSYALEAADEAARSLSKTELLEFLRHALRLAEQTPDAHKRLVRQAQVFRKKAHFWKTVGNFEKSLTAYLKVLKLFPKNAQENVLAGTYKDLGDLYRIKNSYRKGMVCLGRAEKIYRAVGDKSELAHTLNNIGNLYWMTLNHQKALEYLNSALLLHRETGSDAGAASTLNNLAGVYSDLNQYQNSIKYFSESLEIHKRQNHAEETARVLNNLGVVYMYIASYQKAQDSLLESLRINHSTGNLREQVFNLENLGECFLKLGNPSQSLSYSREGLNLAERIGFAFRRGRIQRNIGKSLSQLGEYSSSLENLEVAFQSAESIADTETQAWILLDSAELYLILNRLQRAQEYFDRSQSLLEKLPDTRLKAFSRLIRGR